ncbi:MAG TPA: RHS repeat-associated core domain-containing protein [Bacillota bacterium]|nr:RHS repeat-associated core domain-containing protein [Bacillota bacterium]HOH09964.1 RHS repeat-associated core domain-containing protein [Bacillota bacterium]
MIENGASTEQASAIAFFFYVSDAKEWKDDIDLPYELEKGWLDELPEEFARFMKKWPERKFPEELLPLKAPSRQDLDKVVVSSMARISSAGTPVDVTDYTSLYNVERNQPFGNYFNNHNENINTSSGSLMITQTDFVLPGRYGNDFAFTRYYDSSQSKLEEFVLYDILYFVINAGSYSVWDTSWDTITNPDGSYYTVSYFSEISYNSQTSDDGYAYGIESRYECINYFYAPPDNYDPYNTTTTLLWSNQAAVYPAPEDVTEVSDPVIEIEPYQLSKKATSLASGWNLDFPVYEKGSAGSYIHLGSQGTYKIKSDGYLDKRDSKDIRAVASKEYSYGGVISEWKMTIDGGTTWYFNSRGNPIAKKDRFGQYIRITYDTAGRISKIFDTVGRTIRFTYETSSVVVNVHEDDAISSPILSTWIYNLASTSVGSWKKLISVQPPTGPSTYYSYDEVEARISYGYLIDHFKRLMLSAITHPTQGTSHYSYTQRLRYIFGDNPSMPAGQSDNFAEYILTERYDEIPALEYSGGGLIPSTHSEQRIQFSYGTWDSATNSYTTTATTTISAGEVGKAPAVEKWVYDRLNRQKQHIMTGQECGDDRQKTETVTTTYSYADEDKRTPRSISEETSYSGSSEKTSKETITFYNDHGRPVKVLEPDGTMREYQYDSTYWLTTREYSYYIKDAAGNKLGKETRYTLDSTKTKPLLKQEAVVCMTPTNTFNDVQGPTGLLPNNGSTVWNPLWSTGGDIVSKIVVTIDWSTGGWWGDNQYAIYIKRSKDTSWGSAYYVSPFIDGGLFAKKGTNTTDVIFPEPGFWDIKVLEICGVNTIKAMTAKVAQYALEGTQDYVSTGFAYSTGYPGNIVTVTTYAPYANDNNPQASESVTTYVYDALWNAYPVQQETAVTRADGSLGYSRATAAYDKLGRPTTVRQEGSQGLPSETSYQYDALGRVTLITNPPHEGSLTSTKGVVYNDSQRSVEITNEVGNKIRNTYDGKGRLIASEYLDGGIWKLASHVKYDSLGMETEVTDALGNKTSRQYDAFGREIKVVRPDQTFIETWYANANIALAANPTIDMSLPAGFGSVATKGWKKAVDSGGIASYEGYDLMGRTIWAANDPKTSPPAGAPIWDMVRYEYDALGRMTKSAVRRTDTTWDITAYSYVNAQGKQNPFGKPMSMDLPGTTEGIHSYAYDGRGNLTSETIGASVGMTSSYDELGRKKQAVYSDGTSQTATRFFYDCRDCLTAAEQYENGVLQNSLEMEYNQRGWQISETLHKGAETWALGYGYNATGARTKVIYPDGTYVDYEYDGRGLLSRIPGLFEYLPGYGAAGFSYDANGRLTKARSVNGVTTVRSYDALGRLGGISVGRLQPGDIFSQVYQYTSRDLLSGITEYDGASRALQFGYDNAGRLTSSDIFGYQDRVKVFYSYDGAGNRLSETWKDAQGLTVESFNYTYNPGNYLVNRGSSSFGTGSYGQITSRTEAGVTTTYAYNPMKMMKEASEAGVTLAKYEYDALGRRIISWLDDEWRTVSLWSGNDSIYEIRQEWATPPPNPPTETITRYVAVNGQYLAKLVGSAVVMQLYFHHTDMVGTVRAVTDVSGAVIARYAYEPFGSLTTASGLIDGELHRFTGKPSDLETSLSYFNARYYDPTLGRFTSADPAKDGLNWHVYGNLNPYSRVDRDGLSSTAVMQDQICLDYGSMMGDIGAGIIIVPWFVKVVDWINTTFFAKKADVEEKITNQVKTVTFHMGKIGGMNSNNPDPNKNKETWTKHMKNAFNQIRKLMGKLPPKANLFDIIRSGYELDKAFFKTVAIPFYEALKYVAPMLGIDINDLTWGLPKFYDALDKFNK